MGRNNAAFIVIGIIVLVLGISVKFKNYRRALATPFF